MDTTLSRAIRGAVWLVLGVTVWAVAGPGWTSPIGPGGLALLGVAGAGAIVAARRRETFATAGQAPGSGLVPRERR
jgi:hypothetical protein